MTEQNTTKMEEKIQKKAYTSPKLETIGEVRDMTRGFGSGSVDGGTQYSDQEPSDFGH